VALKGKRPRTPRT